MTPKIHCVVQQPTDLYRFGCCGAIQDEVPRTSHQTKLADRVIAAETQMIRPDANP